MARSYSNKPWEEIVAAFEDYLFKKGKSQNSITSYGSTLRRFGQFYRDELGKPGPYISRLQETDILSFVHHFRSIKYHSSSSINLYIAALKSFSRYILEKRLHKRDITQDLKSYSVPPAPLNKSRLSSKECKRLIASINLNDKHGVRDYAIMQLLIQCGLRTYEISQLTIDDVDLYRTSGRIKIRDEKTRHDRFIPLNTTVRNALRKYIDARGSSAGKSPLFISQKGIDKALSTKRIQYLVKKYLCAAGRKDLSARDLRNNLARGLYEKTKDLSIVQNVLGHKNITTTARYVKPTEKELAAAIEKVPENIFHTDFEDIVNEKD